MIINKWLYFSILQSSTFLKSVNETSGLWDCLADIWPLGLAGSGTHGAVQGHVRMNAFQLL